jgi:endonuclease-3
MQSLQKRQERAVTIIKILQSATHGMVPAASTEIVATYGRDPYLVLISCILSLRTKDTVSLAASHRLFEHARTPEQMIKLDLHTIEQAIYPTGFYRNKAKVIKHISKDLIDRFNSIVPSNESDLLSLHGVGRKTMNLVLSQGFGIPALCVDTHVHRISNRLGLVQTTTPEQTEQELMQVLPRESWIEFNQLMVMWGQNICVPISPKCSECAIAPLCPRIGVTRHR